MARKRQAAMAFSCVAATTFAYGAFGGAAYGTEQVPQFAAPVSYATGTNPFYIAVGDIDDDGNLDMANTNSNDGSVTVRWGTATGAFGSAETINGLTLPCTLVLADVNDDGKLEIITSELFNPVIHVVMYAGSRTFASPSVVAAPTAISSINVGDVTGDDVADLIVSSDSTTPGGNSVIPGVGDGTFGAVTFISGAGVKTGESVLADFNNDGNLDIASPDLTTPADNITVALGTGDSTTPFDPPTEFAVSGSEIELQAGYVNRDAYLDLVMATDDAGTGGLKVLLNSGSGTFPTVRNVATPTPASLRLADMNGDSLLDAVTTVTSTDTVNIQLGDGTGDFGSANSTNTGTGGIVNIGLGDFNRDGKVDAAVTAPTANEDRVLINETVEPTSFAVSYDGNGSTAGSVPVDESSPYVAGSPVTVLGNTGSLAKAGFTFGGWQALPGGGTAYAPNDTFTMPGSAVTLYARWVANVVPSMTRVSASGTMVVGSTLTANVTGLAGMPTPVLTYRWQSSASADGTYADISGATASTYFLPSAQAGRFVKVKAVATNVDGSAVAVSGARGPVTAAPTVDDLSVGGTVKIGVILRARATVSGTPRPTVVYQWQKSKSRTGNFTNVANANSVTYKPLATDVGMYLRVRLQATNSVGTTEAISSPVGPVR